MAKRPTVPASVNGSVRGYDAILADVAAVLESARRASARAVNAVMTAAHWHIGRRIVEWEQGGKDHAQYGTRLLEQLSRDLTKRFGKGFGRENVRLMRTFYVAYSDILWGARQISQTASGKSDDVTPRTAEIKDPFVPEFLGLKDEYSESELEEALIEQLETFLLELGGDFTFVGRQRRLRIGKSWYRIDLLFFHRRLRCLVVIDLKVGKFTHADAGQMHLYLSYAAEHWTNEGEHPPAGLIPCTEHDAAVAHYTLDNLPNKVLAAEYRMTLPDEKTLAAQVQRTRKMLEGRLDRGS